MKFFKNRSEAGRRLAAELERRPDTRPAVVLALPRGGVPVAYEVARALHAPLDVFVVRKLGTPGQSELAMGAIASGGIRILNREVVDALDLTEEDIDRVAHREELEIIRREQAYRRGHAPPAVKDRDVIVVDDGIATGSTMLAAIRALRRLGPRSVTVAVPVAPARTVEQLRREADAVVCLETPLNFWAIGQWYEDFHQNTDAEVNELLAGANQEALTH